MLFHSIDKIKGIGKKRAELFHRLNILTVKDLLYHVPHRWEDRSLTKPASFTVDGETITLEGMVIGSVLKRPRKGLTITTLTMRDASGNFRATWFNNYYIYKNIEEGTRLRVYGKIDRSFNNTVQMTVQDFEILDVKNQTPQGLVPVYPTTAELSQKIIRLAVEEALKEYLPQLEEYLPTDLLKRHQLPGIQKCISDLHKPANMEDVEKAKYRLAFEELFLLQMALLKRKHQLTAKHKPFHYNGNGKLIKGYIRSLPFPLTTAQFRCWKEICADMNSPTPMARMLLGDVGSGKTVVATLTLLKAVESKMQGALMVPTEILARQHYNSIKEELEPLGVNVALVVRGTDSLTKLKVATGEAQVVIGTHALIQEGITFHRLASVVIDEQHRFGVEQRTQLQTKGDRPDVLVMTATPIPRSMAMTLYGDLDLSVIDVYPAGRKTIKTYYAPPARIPGIYDFIKKELDKGRQAYIVCPLVEDSEVLTAQSAETLYNQIVNTDLKGYRVGMVHGRLKQDEKEDIMNQYLRGDLQVLVSTTVIEVGVNQPNASVILILDADRFGLAQLHQLRGRVGRGEHQSYCVLVAEPKNETTVARLKAMCHSNDGFALSEEDLRLRGPGEVFGTKQSGMPDLKIADLWQDRELISVARDEAKKYIDTQSVTLDNAIKERFAGSEIQL